MVLQTVEKERKHRGSLVGKNRVIIAVVGRCATGNCGFDDETK